MTNNTNIVALPTELTIKNIVDVKSQLDSALSQGTKLAISPEQVEEVDTAGMQLLIALYHHCKKEAVVLSCGTLPESILQFAQTIGVDRAQLSS